MDRVPVGDRVGVSSGVEEELKLWEGVDDWEGVGPLDRDAPSVPLVESEAV